MYCLIQIIFLIDAETCIERIGSGALPVAVLKSNAFTKTSSASDESWCLQAGLSSSAPDESNTLGDKVDVVCCYADKGVNVAARPCEVLCTGAEGLLPNWKVLGSCRLVDGLDCSWWNDIFCHMSQFWYQGRGGGPHTHQGAD